MNCPISNVKYHIKGNVQGFPNSVPINAAAIDPPMIQEIKIANNACNPINGVKDIAIPVASPKERAWGVPFILFILKLIYFFVLEKAKNIFIKLKILIISLFFFFLPKGINYFKNLLPGLTAGIFFNVKGISFSEKIGALILAKLV